MSEDVLERAKAADIDSLAGTDWGALREIVQGLIAEVERLRSQSVEQVFRRKNEEIAAKDARIKELEEANRNIDKRRDEMAAFIERLEAAFLDVKIDLLVEACRWREDVAEKEVREALERIKADEKL